MSKNTFQQEDANLLRALGLEAKPRKAVKRSKRDERIIAGFAEIRDFYLQEGKLPQNSEGKDIFERLYAVRLDALRISQEYKALLQEFDIEGLLEDTIQLHDDVANMDDATLLDALGVEAIVEDDITQLKHVSNHIKRQAAEEIASRNPCEDFEDFAQLFTDTQDALKDGRMKTVRFKEDTSIAQGQFFVLGGQLTYVAKVGEEIKATNGEPDARLWVIYDNATESNLLRRSLKRALQKDEAGRRIIPNDASLGPLFSGVKQDDDIDTGIVYVLRSHSKDAFVEKNRKVLHKIGVTGGDVKKRFANAVNDPTFLMAEVEVVASYELANINRMKLEKVLHKFFAPARLDITIRDRFDKPITPREWFLVPLATIEEAINKLQDGSIVNYRYAPDKGEIVPHL